MSREETLRQEAIYARQSVDKKDSVSIETQIDHCKNFAESPNPKIFKDKGFSGKNTERPDLKKLIREIESDMISKVYVYKLDRISRNIVDFYNLYEVMKKHNTEFVSINEHFDTTSAIGRAMMGIIAVFAQMERETIQQRVKDNYYYRIADGRWCGGPAPYGFKNGRTKENIPTLIPIEEELEVVKAVYVLYNDAAHLSLSAICNWLYENGYRTRKGGKFQSSTLSRMLQNPLYSQADEKLYNYFQTRKVKFLNDKSEWDGKHTACIVGKINGNQFIRKYDNMKEQTIYISNFEPIIPSYYYIDIQDRLEKNEKFKPGSSPYPALEELAGKLKCATCGHALKAFSKSTNLRPYLSCHGKTTLKVCDETFKNVNFYELQEKISNDIQNYLNNLDQVHQEKLAENEILSQQKEDTEQELKRLIDLAARGGLTAEALQSAIEERQQRIYELELQIQKNEVSTDYLLMGLLGNDELNFYHNPVEELSNYIGLTIEQRTEIVKFLIDKVLVKPDGTYQIIWNI